MGFVLVLGGARSGKSDLARRLALESSRPVSFIATGAPGDEVMAERIARHREERPAGWKTVEEPATVLVAISTLAVVALARRRLSGATGDVCGATAELGQLAALLAFAATTLK